MLHFLVFLASAICAGAAAGFVGSPEMDNGTRWLGAIMFGVLAIGGLHWVLTR